MNEVRRPTLEQILPQTDYRRLPVAQRASVAERKYAEAVGLYGTTDMSLRQVAEACGVTAAGLSAHIAKYHRPLLYARYGIDVNDQNAAVFKVKPPKGQSLKTHLKYKDAIEACGDIAYIELNVSQVARLFNLSGTALASQLRVHYPDIIPNRERLRSQLGIADNTHRGARRSSIEEYGEALGMYRDTDLTIPEVADKCKVSRGGFSQFMRFYHQDIISEKASRRSNAKRGMNCREAGKISGNGCLYGPKEATVALYAPALELYRTTCMTISEIAKQTGVPYEGFKAYLNHWHRADKLGRRGYDADGVADIKDTRRFLKSTSGKYADAIASLKSNPRPVAEVAAQFGLNPDVFREYLKTHEPEIAEAQGMKRLAGGKVVKRSSYEKYKDAIQEYATTTETLKSIAERHGIVYNSIMGYVLRNCPAERESHRKLVEAAGAL